MKVRPEIVGAGRETFAAARPEARCQYLFHGSSGSSDEEIRAAIPFGVVKINLDSDTQYSGVLKVDGALGDRKAHDQRARGTRAEVAMAARVTAPCKLFGSAGRSAAGARVA